MRVASEFGGGNCLLQRGKMAEKKIECTIVQHDACTLEFHVTHGRAIGVRRSRAFILMTLRVEPRHRHRGIATRILHDIAEWCRGEGLRRIELDDMSIRHRMPGNVYLRAGFFYASASGPEMYGSPRRVVDETRRLLDEWRV